MSELKASDLTAVARETYPPPPPLSGWLGFYYDSGGEAGDDAGWYCSGRAHPTREGALYELAEFRPFEGGAIVEVGRALFSPAQPEPKREEADESATQKARQEGFDDGYLAGKTYAATFGKPAPSPTPVAGQCDGMVRRDDLNGETHRCEERAGQCPIHDKPGFVADHVQGLVSEAVTELKIKREEKERLTKALDAQCRRLSALWDNEKVLRVRAEQRYAAEIDAAKMEAADLRSRLSHLGDIWRLVGESLREFGYEPAGEDQWVAMVHTALTELDKRRRQRTSDANLLVEVLAITDDATEDTEWLILHARLEKFLDATGERGLKNLLGTVTMLRDRLLQVATDHFKQASSGELLDGVQMRVKSGCSSALKS